MIIEITLWEALFAVFIASAIWGFSEGFFKDVGKWVREQYGAWRRGQRRLK